MIMMSTMIQFNISVSIVSNLWNSQLILCFCLFPLHSRALGNSFSSAAAEGNCSFEHNRIEEKKKWKNFFLSSFFFLMKVKSFVISSSFEMLMGEGEEPLASEVEAPFSAFSLHHFTTIILPQRQRQTTTWKIFFAAQRKVSVEKK